MVTARFELEARRSRLVLPVQRLTTTIAKDFWGIKTSARGLCRRGEVTRSESVPASGRDTGWQRLIPCESSRVASRRLSSVPSPSVFWLCTKFMHAGCGGEPRPAFPWNVAGLSRITSYVSCLCGHQRACEPRSEGELGAAAAADKLCAS